ncbi:MAG: CdaR family transcriptional regulator [Oscillospiraceae bacterium]
MELSVKNGIQIVMDFSGIIQQHVNLMDENGVIVASTDEKRIGSFHEGAFKVVSEHLEELIIVDDEQFKGSKKGINLPIETSDTIVGVVGITGEYSEVVKFGQIIKKMTEILIRENLDKQQKKIDDRIRSRFLNEWILDGIQIDNAFIKRGNRLDIDVCLKYRVVVFSIENIREYTDPPEGQMTIDSINRLVRNSINDIPKAIFSKTPATMICLIPYLEDKRILEWTKYLIERIYKNCGIWLLAGIDGESQSVHLAYQQASKALRACTSFSQKRICLYNTINLEIFMDEISSHSKREFLQRIFNNASSKQIGEWVHILELYFSLNGAVSKIADQLFIHKNTLQYKLNRIYEHTGYDPKSLMDSSLFYLAIQFYKDEILK